MRLRLPPNLIVLAFPHIPVRILILVAQNLLAPESQVPSQLNIHHCVVEVPSGKVNVCCHLNRINPVTKTRGDVAGCSIEHNVCCKISSSPSSVLLDTASTINTDVVSALIFALLIKKRFPSRILNELCGFTVALETPFHQRSFLRAHGVTNFRLRESWIASRNKSDSGFPRVFLPKHQFRT